MRYQSGQCLHCFVANVSFAEGRYGILINQHHSTNTNFVIMNNDFTLTDSLWVTPDTAGIRFQTDGSQEQCAKPRATDPTFFAYTMNNSYMIANNKIFVEGNKRVTGIEVFDEDTVRREVGPLEPKSVAAWNHPHTLPAHQTQLTV